MLSEDFGLIIRQRRIAKGLTQQSLAEASGLSLRYIQELEAGEKQPTLTTLFNLAKGLEVTPQNLIAPLWKDWRQKAKKDCT